MTKNKILKIFLFVAILVQLQNVIAEQPTQLVLNYEKIVYDKKFHPGDTGTIMIAIQNTGNLDADKVEATILDLENIHAGGFWKLGTISPGQIRTISVSIKVDKDISPGTYNIPLILEYTGYKRSSYGNLESRKESINWNIPITIYGKENIQIDVERKKFKAKTIGNLTLNINTNEHINDVSVILNSQCVQILGSAKKFIGDLKKGETKKINFEIKPLNIGTCGIDAIIEYYDVSGNIAKTIIPLGIEVSAIDVNIKLNVSYDKIIPGNNAKLKVKVYNSGKDKARDVSLNFILNDPFVAIGSSENSIGDLNSGEEKEIIKEIYVDKNAEIKTYNVLTIITFKVGDEEFSNSINKTIGIFVEGGVELKIIGYEVHYDTSILDVEIANKGTKDAESVEVEIYEDNNLIATKYTGSIGADKSKVFHLPISSLQKKGGEGVKRIKIVVTYKDQKEKFEKEISINASAIKKSEGIEIFIIAFVVIIAIVVYLWRKKKKK